MSIENDIIEINPIKININDIFDKKIELGPLLQFNLLQKVIEEFINRQNKTNDKINKLEIKLNKIYNLNNKNNKNDIHFQDNEDDNEIDINISNLKDNTFINLDNEINELKEKNKNKDKDNDNDNNLNEDNFNKENKENKEINNLNEVSQDINNEKNNSLLNKKEKQIYQLSLKINKLQNNYEELLDNISSLNKYTKKEIQLIKDKYNGYDSRFSKQDISINEINDKLSDLNVYDIFKGDSKDINVDKTTILIKGIEQKLLKKLEFLDLRNKTNEEGIFKLKNELIDIKNNNNAMNQLSKNMKDNYNQFLNDTESKLNIFKKKFDEISGLKKIIDNSVSKNDFINYKNEQNKKINEIIMQNISDKGIPIANNGEKLDDINEDIKTYINKKLEEFDKNLKNINIDLINKEIMKIKQDLNKKLNKENLSSINLKIEQIENMQDNFKLEIDENKNDIYCCNDKCSKVIRMVEHLRGQILSLNKEEKKEDNDPNINKDEEKDKNNNNDINIDLSSYITKTIYDEDINKINKKLEKLTNLESDNYRSIQSIEERIKYFVSENDLTNIEQYLINLIDEYKLKDSKKYVDKAEYQKSYKYLEVQIKHLNDITSKDNENWLLAKKPMNNYMCAACESFIGDLKNKEEYSPWNKIPVREDYNKRYRFGHGFSNMLKMVNMDLLKKFNRINSGINIGIKIDESKKIIKHNLPKINIQNQNDISSIHNINFNNENTYEDLNEKNNNSADNIDNNNEINEKLNSERNVNTDRMINKSTNLNNGNSSFRAVGNIDDGKPKLIKIYKKNKK